MKLFDISMKRCEWCGKLLPADARSDISYCQNKSTCRVAAWRAKQRIKAHFLAGPDTTNKVFYQR